MLIQIPTGQSTMSNSMKFVFLIFCSILLVSLCIAKVDEKPRDGKCKESNIHTDMGALIRTLDLICESVLGFPCLYFKNYPPRFKIWSQGLPSTCIDFNFLDFLEP